jgi:hypothetical protein
VRWKPQLLEDGIGKLAGFDTARRQAAMLVLLQRLDDHGRLLISFE